jgi:hypothetical protein
MLHRINWTDGRISWKVPRGFSRNVPKPVQRYLARPSQRMAGMLLFDMILVEQAISVFKNTVALLWGLCVEGIKDVFLSVLKSWSPLCVFIPQLPAFIHDLQQTLLETALPK